ncbi:uncharacterized protein A4U43_C01F2160 [Asparagus officinalis]|uniref:Small ribosomal subunit protein cS22 n=1 Tax=Asparagus officinalis TaxID=4686 RepID=A0A5P1FQP4_ASPOF|nr:30S ribosomal protein 2, chloroplastic-like isoform X1 [Asparagus officinalis]XP_020271359.1 30S ribosomal protein 2, chloroplastic-like isoform X2 [Asparagus officinalis]ONK79031.1 uncharacterized protein A4U43_C01F2160 [Asparagus officinalis]
MTTISSLFPPNLFYNSKTLTKTPNALVSTWCPSALASSRNPRPSNSSVSCSSPRRNKLVVLAATAEATAQDSEVQRRLYIGNIPRDVDNEQLAKIFGEHGSVEKAEVMYDKYSGRSRRFAFVTMSTIEDANAAIEKLNDTEIGGRKIKVNVTEKPLQPVDLSLLQPDDEFTDSPYKVYVGNLAKTVTSEILSKFFSEKGNVLGAKVSRVPGTSKSSGFGFVSFSSEEEVEAAISSCNNAFLEGQRIRVNKA